VNRSSRSRSKSRRKEAGVGTATGFNTGARLLAAVLVRVAVTVAVVVAVIIALEIAVVDMDAKVVVARSPARTASFLLLPAGRHLIALIALPRSGNSRRSAGIGVDVGVGARAGVGAGTGAPVLSVVRACIVDYVATIGLQQPSASRLARPVRMACEPHAPSRFVLKLLRLQQQQRWFGL
jgi:hypothetical protein